MIFLKKHRFKILIGSLSMILLIVSFYMLWVHVPYARNENRLETIKNTIINENKYQYKDYFTEYVGENTYYVIKVEEDKEEKYVVFDTKQEYVKSFVDKVANQAKVEQAFKDKYQASPRSVEIGYEDGLFMYYLTCLKEGELIYAFYGLDSGDFIKAYQLG